LSSFSIRPSALVVKAGVGLHVAKSQDALANVSTQSQSQHRCLSLYIYGSLVLSLLSLLIVFFFFFFFFFLSLLVFTTRSKEELRFACGRGESFVKSFFPFGIQNPILSPLFVLYKEKSLFRLKDWNIQRSSHGERENDEGVFFAAALAFQCRLRRIIGIIIIDIIIIIIIGQNGDLSAQARPGRSVQSGRRRVRPGGPVGRVVQPRDVSNHAETNGAGVVPGHASEQRRIEDEDEEGEQEQPWYDADDDGRDGREQRHGTFGRVFVARRPHGFSRLVREENVDREPTGEEKRAIGGVRYARVRTVGRREEVRGELGSRQELVSRTTV